MYTANWLISYFILKLRNKIYFSFSALIPLPKFYCTAVANKLTPVGQLSKPTPFGGQPRILYWATFHLPQADGNAVRFVTPSPRQPMPLAVMFHVHSRPTWGAPQVLLKTLFPEHFLLSFLDELPGASKSEPSRRCQGVPPKYRRELHGMYFIAKQHPHPRL